MIKNMPLSFDYNSGFCWSIFILLYQWKQEAMLYKAVNKIDHFTNVSPHYLVKLKQRINGIV